jgi:hypothetical protein
MPKSFLKTPKMNGLRIFGASKKEKRLFINGKKKALFVNISGSYYMPFNSDFRVTEIPE